MPGGVSYGEAIRAGFAYLLQNYPEVFVLGQGVWSPWYVGSSMTDLEKEFGKDRVIDTPVSEEATTGAAVGASVCGYKPIVIHPRMDFMVLAVDPIVNQAAKWGHMLGGHARPSMTVRGIINRGGEQGAQHSQALHAWFAHVPGLRVVMPATVADARDLLIAAVLSADPVVYIDDRWLYEQRDELEAPAPVSLAEQGPKVLQTGTDITLVGAGWAVEIARQAAKQLNQHGISAEVVDLRVLNPMKVDLVADSVRKTGRLIAVDGGWRNCGLSAEIVAAVSERLEPWQFKSKPQRLTLADAPAPTSKVLEAIYYPSVEQVAEAARGAIEDVAVSPTSSV